jgi:hypothetical protein
MKSTKSKKIKDLIQIYVSFVALVVKISFVFGAKNLGKGQGNGWHGNEENPRLRVYSFPGVFPSRAGLDASR